MTRLLPSRSAKRELTTCHFLHCNSIYSPKYLQPPFYRAPGRETMQCSKRHLPKPVFREAGGTLPQLSEYPCKTPNECLSSAHMRHQNVLTAPLLPSKLTSTRCNLLTNIHALATPPTGVNANAPLVQQ